MKLPSDADGSGRDLGEEELEILREVIDWVQDNMYEELRSEMRTSPEDALAPRHPPIPTVPPLTNMLYLTRFGLEFVHACKGPESSEREA